MCAEIWHPHAQRRELRFRCASGPAGQSADAGANDQIKLTTDPDEVRPMRGTPSAAHRPDGPDRAMTDPRGRWTIWPGNGPLDHPTRGRRPGLRTGRVHTATRPTVGRRPMSRPTGSELLTTRPQVTDRPVTEPTAPREGWK